MPEAQYIWKKKCNLTLAVSPTCPQHKPSAYLLATFSITSHLKIDRGLLLWQIVKALLLDLKQSICFTKGLIF